MDNVPNSAAKRLTIGHCFAIILGVMILSALLALWQPLMVAPPDNWLTTPLYGLVLCSWLPTMLICFFLKPIGDRALAIVYGVILGLIAICVLGTAVIIQASSPAKSFDCQPPYPTFPGFTRFTCTVTYQDVEHAIYETDPQPVTFEGPAGFFLVWRVNN
jgi:hypothetical protein